MRRALAAFALGCALAWSSLLFDTPSLAPAGVTFALVGAAAGIWVWLASFRARVDRTFAAHTVEEGKPLEVEFTFRSGVVPPPGGELRDDVLDAPLSVGLRAEGGHERLAPDVPYKTAVRFDRRGRRLLEPGTLAIEDPLGIAARSHPVGGEEHEVLVLPRIEPIVAVAPGGGAVGGGSGSGEERKLAGAFVRPAAEIEVDGLRPYRPGTPASRIYWPGVARGGEMLERRLVADADSAPLVVLDTAAPVPEADLDAAVRAAASIIHMLARGGGCAALLPGDRRPRALAPDLLGWPQTHARLALVERDSRRPPLARIARAGAVIWVGAGRPPRDLGRAAGGGAWLVMPHPPAAARAIFTVAGCTGVAATRVTAGRAA